MATDAQGRELSDDGYYYWDGSAWQPVDQSAASGEQGSSNSTQSQNVDAQGRQLSDDGNYYWDGSDWQPVENASANGEQNDDAWIDEAAFEVEIGAEHEASVDLPDDAYSDIDAEATS
jgi:hypothetical protein